MARIVKTDLYSDVRHCLRAAETFTHEEIVSAVQRQLSWTHIKSLIYIDDSLKAEYKGQMELYLRWLDKYMKCPGEKSPIGLVLCAGKNEEHVRLLELNKSNLQVEKQSMKKTQEMDVSGTVVHVVKIEGNDYVCLTDMAKLKSDDANATICNWMRNRMTIEYLGLWETLYNPNFKPLEFEGFRRDVGLNSFTMSPSKRIQGTSAIGIAVSAGRYGGTYARNDIAFKFAA